MATSGYRFPKGSSIDPVVMGVLQNLVQRESEVGRQYDHVRTPHELLKLDTIFNTTIAGYPQYTECFFFHLGQSREPDYYPAGQNYTSGSLHFSTAQAIIMNGGHTPTCESYLYSNSKIVTGEHLTLIDADTRSQISGTRSFTGITIRGIFIYSKYLVLEFQFMSTSNTQNIIDNYNSAQGSVASQYNLDTGSVTTPGGGMGDAGQGAWTDNTAGGYEA